MHAGVNAIKGFSRAREWATALGWVIGHHPNTRIGDGKGGSGQSGVTEKVSGAIPDINPRDSRKAGLSPPYVLSLASGHFGLGQAAARTHRTSTT